jgi:Vault protein inter-alpha-trypsin domain/von Willebrand factor type A domain/FecR protein
MTLRRAFAPIAGALVLTTGIGASILVHDHATKTADGASGSPAKITRVLHLGPDKGGGLVEGAPVAADSHLSTDAWTRARVELADGTLLSLDRGTSIVLSGSRALELVNGQLALDVDSPADAPEVRVHTAHGDVAAKSARLVVTATPDRTTVETARGSASLLSSDGLLLVSAGEEGVKDDAKARVTAANDVARRLSWSERLTDTTTEGASPRDTSSGLGELVAKRPGRADEKDHALHLATHTATVRIASSVARTEVLETFANDTNDDLEGVYRFPLPAGAQIEKLALDVDGKMVAGSFVDNAKGAAIWRGAIQNAAPKAQKPQEEIVWVPGPWHDPALLEWNGGGRFELKIFPIPKHGSRRIQIAYTEVVPQVAEGRRYVYPLPEFAKAAPTIDHFAVDVQVRGADANDGVHAGGYDLRAVPAEAAVGLGLDAEHFTPSGDLTIDYALDTDHRADLTAWAYRDPEPRPVSPPANVDGSADESDPFVVLALRPQLPRYSHEGWRDQVIVVDDGHSMTGLRFQEAAKLAARIAGEMDRRDRVTLLVCDITCRSLPARANPGDAEGVGWLSPGASAKAAVEEFLSSVTPDGATDLISAVRKAGSIQGRVRANDLRVILLSSGIAGAGYRKTDRLATEVSEALPDAKAEVVSVPIGSDADQRVLQEIARGGGGVVVPYLPSRPTEQAALEVLNATYGATLRDVEVTLPEGLYAVAPSSFAPIRAGAEELVVARMHGDHLSGEAVLKGKVGGQAFEARYPLDVRASTEPGNAFVPRLYASERIASVERTEGESARPELVHLSQRFSVPSRYTSLLVLESEAMFRAFGIDRTTTNAGSAFTGENEAVASYSTTPGAPSEKKPSAGYGKGDAFGADLADDAVSGQSFESGGGGGAARESAPAKMSIHARATAAPAVPAATVAAANVVPAESSKARRLPMSPPAPPVGRWMRREWFRSASISRPVEASSATFERIAAARAALLASPDERSKHKELVRLLARAGSLDALEEELGRWTTKDPLDADAIVARADLLARRGRRDESLRVLSGILGAPGSAKAQLDLEKRLAVAYTREGSEAAGSFWIPLAEDSPKDLDLVAHAAACERALGRPTSSERWLAKVPEGAAKEKVRLLFDKLYEGPAGPFGERAAPAEQASWGDIVVDASWGESAGRDLDIVVIDPAGNRQSWSSSSGAVRVSDPRSVEHESCAFSSSLAGGFLVEVVQSHAEASSTPIHGTVRIRSHGVTESRTFELVGARAEVARVDLNWESRLVPADGPVL